MNTATELDQCEQRHQLDKAIRDAVIIHALIDAGGSIIITPAHLHQIAGFKVALSRDPQGAIVAQLLNDRHVPITTPNAEIRRIKETALAALIARGGLITTISDSELQVNLDRDIFWQRGQGQAATIWKVGPPKLVAASHQIILNNGSVN